MKRQRIRITIAGHSEKLFPTELKEEQLLYHEHRFLEHMNEKLECSKPIDSDENGNFEVLPIVALNEVFIGEAHSSRYVHKVEICIMKHPVRIWINLNSEFYEFI